MFSLGLGLIGIAAPVLTGLDLIKVARPVLGPWRRPAA
jgi:hypothetical protein